MRKIRTGALVAACLITSSVAFAQAPLPTVVPQGVQSESVSQALIDRRIEVLKVTLGLTADQAKLWPPVEEAIRSRLTARHARLVSLVARAQSSAEIDPIQVLRNRAKALSERSAGLSKLADAWQPLYASLDNNQKLRLHFIAAYILGEMRDAVESRLIKSEDEDEE
jgi:hypothetical protein